MSRWIVVMTTGNDATYAYGPIDDAGMAQQFADFLTKEVDPAKAVELVSPMDELLAFVNNGGFRAAFKAGQRPLGWPPQPGDAWEDRNGDRWMGARAGKHPYLFCLARPADDNAEEIWRVHGPMTRVLPSIAPTAKEEPPF